VPKVGAFSVEACTSAAASLRLLLVMVRGTPVPAEPVRCLRQAPQEAERKPQSRERQPGQLVLDVALVATLSEEPPPGAARRPP